MKVQVVIEWNPKYRRWDWQILDISRHEPSREIRWGYTLTRRGAQSKVASALADLKHQREEDERNLSRSIQFEAEICQALRRHPLFNTDSHGAQAECDRQHDHK